MFTLVKNIDYPRDPETRSITAAIHPELQVSVTRGPGLSVPHPSETPVRSPRLGLCKCGLPNLTQIVINVL